MKFKDIFLLPNLITISRLIITSFMFIYTIPNQFTNNFLIVLIAIIGISDSIDGIIARKFNQVSKLGTILDPVTDRIVFILLIIWLSSFFNNIFLYSLLLREILISVGGIYILIKDKTVKVSNKGKIGTALIFISICLTILNITLKLVFIDYFTYFSLIFYYYVALEYLYNLKNE